MLKKHESVDANFIVGDSEFYHMGTATSGKLYDKFKVLFAHDESLDDDGQFKIEAPKTDFRTM